jgi:hypothetical protein
MYLVQGHCNEVPQETHFWNNRKIPETELEWLDPQLMVRVAADPQARKRTLLPFFHMPILGGWKNFTVVSTRHSIGEWFIGWKTDDVCGLSLIPVRNAVRVLKGPGETFFFGVDPKGMQVPVQIIGEGVLGQTHAFQSVPLR